MQFFDESFASFRDFLLLHFCLEKIAAGCRPRQPGRSDARIRSCELTLDRLAQFNIIDVARDADGFDELAGPKKADRRNSKART
jgi:hypothetical protein